MKYHQRCSEKSPNRVRDHQRRYCDESPRRGHGPVPVWSGFGLELSVHWRCVLIWLWFENGYDLKPFRLAVDLNFFKTIIMNSVINLNPTA